MIPSWNSAAHLEATIRSVVNQDGGADEMQIMVVDDASTDATAEIVRAFGPRVSYRCNDRNVGAVENFNVCIAQAKGELVHILHADDLVAPGFYDALDAAFVEPAITAATAVTSIVDANGVEKKRTRSERSGSGPWTNALDALSVSNRMFPSSTVVRRSTYERLGGFRTELPHAADWEMWARIAASGKVWFEDQALAMYRVHGASDTNQRVLSGANMRERLEAAAFITDAYVVEEQRRPRLRAASRYGAAFASRTALDLARRREWSGARRQLVEAFTCLRESLRYR